VIEAEIYVLKDEYWCKLKTRQTITEESLKNYEFIAFKYSQENKKVAVYHHKNMLTNPTPVV